MPNEAEEAAIRVAVSALVVVVFAVGITFRLRAARDAEDLWTQRRSEGTALLALRGVSILGMLGLLLTYFVDPALLAWAQMPLPGWIRWTALAAGLAGVPLLYWVLRDLGGNLTDTVAIRRGHTLITSGPYRWVRHPFYLVTTLELVAISVALASGLLIFGVALLWVYLWRRTPLEEAKLTERFGDEYRAYIARTGRFVPRLTRTQRPRPE